MALRSEIELLSSMEVRDLLRQFPVLNCQILFVDGRLAATPEILDMWMETSVGHLEAVEFYRDGRDAPEVYRRLPSYAPSFSQCSVLVAWNTPQEDGRRGWPRLLGAAAALLVLVVIL